MPICGKDFKTGQTLIKTVLAPMFKARMLGVAGWYSTNILGNRDGEVLDDPESFKTKEESKLGVLEYILQPQLYPELYGEIYHKVRINYYPPRGDNKEGWDNIDIFGWLGYPMQIKIDFLCRDSILAAPLVLDLALFLDLAQRAGMSGIQEWLSFYFKSPQVAPGLYPEHDLFIQQTKLKNTLRWLMGEEQITHLGIEYYQERGGHRPMKYFHRAHLSPDAVIARATEFLARRLTPVEESARRRRFSGAIGQVDPLGAGRRRALHPGHGGDQPGRGERGRQAGQAVPHRAAHPGTRQSPRHRRLLTPAATRRPTPLRSPGDIRR